ncbi:MAG: DUF3060 domain-containing protein [Janthinobacterium lividum]
MKTIITLAMLATASLALSSAAHAQTSITTNGAGSTTIQSNGATISTPTTATPTAPARAGRPKVQPRSAARKPKVAAATQDVTIDGNLAHRTIECQGNTVTVNGNSNRLILRGPCTKLVLNGSDNTVRWTGEAPVVSDLGTKNVTGQIN